MPEFMRLSTALAAASALTLVVATARAGRTLSDLELVDSESPSGLYVDRKLSRSALAILVRDAMAHAPFSLASSRARSIVVDIDTVVVSVPRSVPLLELKALVGGPPWQAVVGGLPGASGDIVVRAGNSFPPFRVRTVSATGVSISTADTSWSLQLPRRDP